ncbi:Vps54-domain-containing protein [Basidiobolus meristosporus CBS 931.73]|uniref:Vacuolar protein sorting-associated protein 54 n=1 Tax=Basidiobolus meristosporus CBS 931.73 TaxID=1314790 RepID=A0A1Y1YQ89_9FUNG|nr:Vps54-domain-containing protein [Basidiobolus meristosporus CBS 931.73]|eukprot:ORX99734.1 Vps54-domain-containing protein [Basidiobolus meristosporus CBS 931.73]
MASPNSQGKSDSSASGPDSTDNVSIVSTTSRHKTPSSRLSSLTDAVPIEKRWTTKEIGKNAISGVLNDPNRGGNTVPKLHKNDLPIVPHAAIKKIKTSDFDEYIKKISSVFENYEANQNVGVSLFSDEFKGIDSTFEEGSETSTDEAQEGRNGTADPIILEGIPEIFFSPDFSLENPETFESVCNGVSMFEGNDREAIVEQSTVLQEKLSQYLDTVEVRLTKEISRRSPAFFAAVSNLQEIHGETQYCVSKIHTLRDKMSKLSDRQSKKGLDVIRLQRRRTNLNLLFQSVKMIAEVKTTQPMIQVLLGQSDFIGALDLIAEANRALNGTHNTHHGESKDEFSDTNVNIADSKLDIPSVEVQDADDSGDQRIVRKNIKKVQKAVDIRGVRALVHFNGQLAEMFNVITKMLQSEFVRVVIEEFKQPIPEPSIDEIKSVLLSSPTEGILQNTNTLSTFTSSLSITTEKESLKGVLAPLLLGLLKTGQISPALSAYKEALSKELDNTIKEQLPENLKAVIRVDFLKDQEKNIRYAKTIPHENSALFTEQNIYSEDFGKQLRSMTFDAFFSLLLSMFSVLLHHIRKAAAIHDLLAEVVNEALNHGVEIDIGEFHALMDINDDKPKAITPQYNNRSNNAESLNYLGITMEKRSHSLPPLSEEPETPFFKMTNESAEILHGLLDTIHLRCSKLISLRNEQNAQLNPIHFYRLCSTMWSFILEEEFFCQKLCFGLRGTLTSLAKSFLTRFHMERTKQLALLIESEQWIQAEVPVEFQQIVDDIIAASHESRAFKSGPNKTEQSDPPAERDPSDGVQSVNESASPVDETARRSQSIDLDRASMLSSGSNATSSHRQLEVDGQEYFVVGCALMLLKMLEDYLQCLSNIPVLTTDVFHRILELLKLFNSRTCQVILGAGAMKSAGLKNITAKHLALASQTLGVVIAIIPFVQNCVRVNMSTKHALLLTEFDRVLRDFKEHQSELHEKLITIMKERAAVHCRSLKTIKWDTPAEADAQEKPNRYMEIIVKETTTLHKVLSKYLPSETIMFVMSRVTTMYESRLQETIEELDITTEIGKERLMVDVNYFSEKLFSLEGVEPAHSKLVESLKQLELKSPRKSLSLS